MESTPRETTEVPDDRAFRLNVTVKPQTKSRLDEARNRRAVEINVSQVCDRAINAELDRIERPGLADLLTRLSIESDRRRGVPYRLGHLEGTRWAREVGSWAEICGYARLDEGDVVLGDVTWKYRDSGKVSGTALGFRGRFVAPREDYRANMPSRWGAPCFVNDDEELEKQPHLCDQYWRGWLAGVREVFAEVSKQLEPVYPPEPQSVAPQPFDDGVPPGDIDPDDIPF
jgi:hypothetical protein